MDSSLFKVYVYDNVIEVIPKEGIEDNCVYDITFRDIYSKHKDKKIDEKTISVCTKIDPLYCSLEAVKNLVGTYDITDDQILYNIREASEFAEYVKLNTVSYEFEKDEVKASIRKDTPFEVSEYVKYKASYTCLLREYIKRSNELGLKGTLGDVSFDNPTSLDGMKDLLKELKALVDEWEMYLRGYGFEGRAKMKSAVKSIKAKPNNKVRQRHNNYTNNYSRGVF